jgi:hypothetical protein
MLKNKHKSFYKTVMIFLVTEVRTRKSRTPSRHSSRFCTLHPKSRRVAAKAKAAELAAQE